MTPGKLVHLFIFMALALGGPGFAQQAPPRYHAPAEVGALLQEQAGRHPGLAALQAIGKSAGGETIPVMQLAAEGAVAPAKRPAIMVCANIEGSHLIGTEAALLIIDRLLAGFETDAKIQELLKTRTVYVAPLLNPDAAKNYFANPKQERTANANPTDEDMDGATDEDGPEDLNGDGMITMMRVKDPEGEYIADPKEPRLMRKADPAKGEHGVYKLYTEGIDNDGDGSINEDPAGGPEPNRNFPQDFENNSIAAGRWPVSQPETLALAKFMFDHPTIALALCFSSENTLLKLELGGQAAEQPAPPAPGARRSRWGAPAAGIDAQDKPLYEAVQKEFREALKAAKSDYPEKKARGAGRGSLVSWGYFQYGVPVFSNDIWAVPEPPRPEGGALLDIARLKGMSREQFLAIKDKSLEEFLKRRGIAAKHSAQEIRGLIERGEKTPATLVEMIEKEIPPAATATTAPEAKKEEQAGAPDHPDADLLKWCDGALKGQGFVPWTKFQHPALGEVEIGGFAPFVRTLPPPERMVKPVQLAADFYISLMQRLGGVSILETRVEALDDSLYAVTLYLANPGRFPTSTAQGRRSRNAWPITVKLEMEKGQSLFSGRPIEKVDALGASGGVRKLEWTIRGPRGSAVGIRAESPRLGAAQAQVTLEKRGSEQ